MNRSEPGAKKTRGINSPDIDSVIEKNILNNEKNSRARIEPDCFKKSSEIKPSKQGIYRRFLKRALDFSLSLIALFVLIPVYLIVGILVRVKLGTPVLFKQERPGLNEEIFLIYKFRTMTSERDNNGDLLPDSTRLTRFGRGLRSTSLDELPELWNIIRGDMSIVGPRPLETHCLPYYTEAERERHFVRPGLTGLAQVNGRNNTTWEERFRFDIRYANELSFLGDAKIILKTILKVIQRSDIGEVGVDSLEDFDKYRTKQQNNLKDQCR